MKVFTNRFMSREAAQEFAKRNNAKVERCPTVKSNKSGYFKYQVITEGEGLRGGISK